MTVRSEDEWNMRLWRKSKFEEGVFRPNLFHLVLWHDLLVFWFDQRGKYQVGSTLMKELKFRAGAIPTWIVTSVFMVFSLEKVTERNRRWWAEWAFEWVGDRWTQSTSQHGGFPLNIQLRRKLWAETRFTQINLPSPASSTRQRHCARVSRVCGPAIVSSTTININSAYLTTSLFTVDRDCCPYYGEINLYSVLTYRTHYSSTSVETRKFSWW